MILLFINTLFPAMALSQGRSANIVTLNEAIDRLCLISPSAKIEKLKFQTAILQFENYKKSFLPSFLFKIDPVNFNRSLRLLQAPSDGSYSYVEDYSNSSRVGIYVRQKIGFTGGELNIGSDINYLHEFSRNRNSFRTMPFSIGYSQRLFGGWKQYHLERDIEYAKNKLAIKQYCTNLAQIQQHTFELYMQALIGKMEQDLFKQNLQNTDTLLQVGRIKLDNGYITEHDLKQVELQLLNARYNFENAHKNYLEAKEQLTSFLGINDLEVEIPEFDIPIVIELSKVMVYIEQNNPFCEQQSIQGLEAELGLLTSKLKNRFNASISINYGINQYAETLAHAYENGNSRQSIIVRLQIPIFQWGINENHIQIAENRYKVNKLSLDNQLREFRNEVKKIVNNYNHSLKLWLNAKTAYGLSQEQYQVLIQNFLYGKVSVYELTAALRAQNEAMYHYYSAISNTYRSYFQLRTISLYDFKKSENLEELLII